MSRPRIPQGVTRAVRAYDIVDDEGDPLLVDGWTVKGVACRDYPEGEVLTEWSTAPTAGQGQATAIGREVRLLITPALSSTWNCDRVAIQAEMTSPDGTRTERIIDQIFDVDREAVRT